MVCTPKWQLQDVPARSQKSFSAWIGGHIRCHLNRNAELNVYCMEDESHAPRSMSGLIPMKMSKAFSLRTITRGFWLFKSAPSYY